MARMESNHAPRHSIEDISRLTEMPVRTIRYYIQTGLVSRPHGERRAAWYDASHLEQLLTIRKWQGAGLSLDRIREILAGNGLELSPPPRPRGPGSLEVWSHLVVSDGLEVTLEPSRAGLDAEQVRAFVRGVMALYRDIRETGKGEESDEQDDA